MCFQHPKPFFGGAAFVLVACMLPTLITLPVQFYAMRAGTPPDPSLFRWIMAGSMLLGILFIPLYAGYLRVIDASERGLPARALDVFKPYAQAEAWRLFGYGLAILVVYVALLGIIIAVIGSDVARWYMHLLAVQADHQVPTALPHGFGTAVALVAVLGIFMMGFYAISFGQVALRGRGVLAAIGDGIVGALKNVLPLLVYAVSLVLACVIVGIVFAIVLSMLALLGGLVSPWLALALIIPIDVGTMLLFFAMSFGVMYALWQDVCGDDSVVETVPTVAA